MLNSHKLKLNNMKYVLRALKYFLTMALTLIIVLAVLAAFNLVEADVDKIFINGMKSVWQIALILAVISAIYPKFGYGRRRAHINADEPGIRASVIRVMTVHGYIIETDEGKTMTFRKASAFAKAAKIWEDRISVEIVAAGAELEGLTKDVVRLVSSLEAIQTQEDE